MEMMQNAMMFQDAAPVALPQSGRGTGSARPANSGGRFAELMQDKQPADEAGAAADPQAGEARQSPASRQGALLRLQNSYGSPASAAGGAQDSQPAPDAGAVGARNEAAAGQGGSATEILAPKWQNAQLVASDGLIQQQPAAESAGNSGAAAAPVMAKGADRWTMYSDIQRNSLAAGAQEIAALTDPQQGRGAFLAGAGAATTVSMPATGRAKGTERVEGGTLSVRKSLAAEAQETAPLAALAQQSLAGMLLATAKDTGMSATPADAMPGTTKQGGIPAAFAAGGAEQAPAAEMPATAGAVQAAAPEAIPGGQAQLPQAGGVQQSSAQVVAVKPAFDAATALKQAELPAEKAQARKDGADQAAAAAPVFKKDFKASAVMVPEGPQNAAAQEKAVPVTPGAPEKEPQVTASAGSATKDSAIPGVKVATTAQPAPQAVTEAAPADATPQPERVAPGLSEGKGARAALESHGGNAAARVAETAGSKPEATVEEIGSKTAPLTGSAKFVPFQGSAGQGGSGDPDKKGHPEQKAQGSEAPVQPQGAGLQAATLQELPQPEAKAVTPKSALHESILAQVKDGVVTHDGTGNGEMSIRLNPGELGELKIQVRMDDNNRLRVEVQADNKMVKDLLMGNLDSLKDSLTAKNFTMEGFDVSTGGGFNSPLPEQKESPRQQLSRPGRAGGYSDQGEDTRVNYLTAEVNNLLDVRF
jgi:flagellar hook-length control protein FliK